MVLGRRQETGRRGSGALSAPGFAAALRLGSHLRIAELGGSWTDHPILPLYAADEEARVECFAQGPS